MSSLRVFIAALVFGIAAESFAITYIVPPDRFEIERASAIVVGRVLGSHVESSPFGIETVTTIALEEAIKGATGNVVQIHTPGGTLDGETRIVPGVPTFADGERVLLFLYQRHDGAYVISDLGLGTFRFVGDGAGRELAVRNESEIEGWDAAGNVHVERQRSAERFLHYVRGVVRGEAVAEDYVVPELPAMVKTESLRPIATTSFTATSYMLMYNSGLGTRWNVFPRAVSWNQGSSETGTLGSGTAEINAAFSTWNAGGAHYVLSSASANSNGFLDATDGTNNIVFEKNLTSAGLQPFSCSSGGALGIAGMTHASFGAGTHVFRGETFATTLEADVSMNQGVGACANFPSETFKSAIVHEFGHTLGIRHSDQNRSLTASCAGDPTLDCTSSALMNHILYSGLNGQLQAWDNAALDAVYGTAPSCTPPSISQQPFGASINSGNSAQLFVGATGTAPLSYQWFAGATGDSSAPVNGGTTSTIVVTPANTTSYWVRVTGACGPVANSNTATVSVAPACTPPSIILQPLGASIDSGNSAQLSASATGTFPLSYQWFVGAVGDTSTPVNGGTTSTIVVTPANTTSYWVRVTGACGPFANSNAAIVAVTVCVPPQILNTLNDQTVVAGSTVSLSVSVNGTSPSVTWFANGIVIAFGPTLITPLTRTTQFRARVTNNCGSADSNPATINVAPPRRRTVLH